MIEFLQLTLRNFLSYGNVPTVIDLSTPGSTLIVGRNLDGATDGAASNGVGKTVMINAITFALYDKPLSDVNKDSLVNTINGKHMEVSVTFKVKDKYYKVIRARKMKAGPYGNYAKLYERTQDANFTDADEITLDSNRNSTDYLTRAIGIPHELFVRIIVFSGSHVPFLSLPSKHPTSPSQQSFIEELFDLKMLSAKAEVLKQMIKDNEAQWALTNAQIEMVDKQRAAQVNQLEDARRKVQNWTRSRDAEVESLRAKLKRIEGIDLDAQQSIHQQIVDLDKLIRANKLTVAQLTRDHKDATTHLTKLDGEMTHLQDATCPYCHQEYKANEDKINEIEAHVAELREAIGLIDAEISKELQEQASLLSQVDDLKRQLQFEDIQELISIRFKKDEIAASITRLSEETNPFIAVVDMIESQQLIDVDRSSLNELHETMEHQRFLLKLLTKNDSFIRKAMLNKNLPFLNSRLNYYLRRMELPHVVEFTHDLTPKISRFGSELEFNGLSTGQRARVNLALSLSFRDVLQNLHQRINLFCLDEVLDMGLDSTGVMLAAKLMKEEARKSGTCMFVISHREEITSSFDKKMYVLFENNFSKAYQSPEDVEIAEQRLHNAA